MKLIKKTISILAIILILTATISTASAASFTDLKTAIDGTKNGILNLNTSYLFNDGFDANGISLTQSITINGNGHTIDLNNLGRFLQIKKNIQVTINNLTIINGKSTGTGGGSIWLDNGILNLNNVTILNSTAKKYGGAIYQKGNTQLNIIDSNIANNTAKESGGAIFNAEGKLLITGTLFQDNEAYNHGGAIRAFESFNISDSIFNNNKATGPANRDSRGGAINLVEGTGYISNSLFTNNAAKNGGAIRTNGTLSIENTIFEDNTGVFDANNILSNDNGKVILNSLQGYSSSQLLNNQDYKAYNQSSILEYFQVELEIPETPEAPETPENPDELNTQVPLKSTPEVSSDDPEPDTAKTGNTDTEDSTIPSTTESQVSEDNGSEELSTSEEPGIPAGVEDADEENTSFTGEENNEEPSTSSGNIPMQNTGMPIVLLILAILSIFGVSVKK